MLLQRRDNSRSWSQKKKDMASPRRGKRKLPVEDSEGFEEGREIEEDEDHGGEEFD